MNLVGNAICNCPISRTSVLSKQDISSWQAGMHISRAEYQRCVGKDEFLALMNVCTSLMRHAMKESSEMSYRRQPSARYHHPEKKGSAKLIFINPEKGDG